MLEGFCLLYIWIKEALQSRRYWPGFFSCLSGRGSKRLQILCRGLRGQTFLPLSSSGLYCEEIDELNQILLASGIGYIFPKGPSDQPGQVLLQEIACAEAAGEEFKPPGQRQIRCGGAPVTKEPYSSLLLSFSLPHYLQKEIEKLPPGAKVAAPARGDHPSWFFEAGV